MFSNKLCIGIHIMTTKPSEAPPVGVAAADEDLKTPSATGPNPTQTKPDLSGATTADAASTGTNALAGQLSKAVVVVGDNGVASASTAAATNSATTVRKKPPPSGSIKTAISAGSMATKAQPKKDAPAGAKAPKPNQKKKTSVLGTWSSLASVVAAGPLTPSLLGEMSTHLTKLEAELEWKDAFLRVVQFRAAQHGAPSSVVLLAGVDQGSLSEADIAAWIDQQQWMYRFFCEQFEINNQSSKEKTPSTVYPTKNVCDMFIKLELLRMVGVQFYRHPAPSKARKSTPVQAAAMTTATAAAAPAPINAASPAPQVPPTVADRATMAVARAGMAIAREGADAFGSGKPSKPLYPASVSALATAMVHACKATENKKNAVSVDPLADALKSYISQSSGTANVTLTDGATKSGVGAWSTPSSQVEFLIQKEQKKKEAKEKKEAEAEAAKKAYRDKLNAEWNAKVDAVREHRDKFGHCDNLPHHLMRWLNYNRKKLKGEQTKKMGELTDDQKRRLQDVGVLSLRKGVVVESVEAKEKKVRENALSASPHITDKLAQKLADPENFEEQFQEMKKFYEEHGHCVVPEKTMWPLRQWLLHIRNEYKEVKTGAKSIILTPERIDRLKSIEFSFEARVKKTFDEHFNEWTTYREQHGKDPPWGTLLGKWVLKTRMRYHDHMDGVEGRLKAGARLTAEQIERLIRRGFHFGTRNHEKVVRSWDESYEELLKYRAEHGHTHVPQREPNIGDWVHRQRSAKTKGTLSEERVDKLNAVDFVWITRKRPAKRPASEDGSKAAARPAKKPRAKSTAVAGAAAKYDDESEDDYDEEAEEEEPPESPLPMYSPARQRYQMAGAAGPAPQQEHFSPPPQQQEQQQGAGYITAYLRWL